MNSAVDALLGVLGQDLFRNPLAPGAVSAGNSFAPPTDSGQPPAGTVPPVTDPGSSSGGSGPVWNPTGKYPDAIWGGSDNVKSQTPPDWLKQLVSQYLASPSDKQWRHLMLGEGVGAQYQGLTMPPWLQSWLRGQLGAEPGTPNL